MDALVISALKIEAEAEGCCEFKASLVVTGELELQHEISPINK